MGLGVQGCRWVRFGLSRFKFGLVWSWVGCGVWDFGMSLGAGLGLGLALDLGFWVGFGGWVGFGFSIGFGVSGWVWGFELDLGFTVGVGV